jgi:hypothetical protein
VAKVGLIEMSGEWGSMFAFVYRCPSTGLNVQGWFTDEPAANETDSYETVKCLACNQLHLINRATGKTIGQDDE